MDPASQDLGPSSDLITSHNALPLEHLRTHILPQIPTSLPTGYRVELHTAKSLPSSQFAACFRLLRDGMRDMYKRSCRGWSPAEKRKEMKHPAMRYLLLLRPPSPTCSDDGWEDSDTDEDVAGFCSFMITEEDETEVVYCYELHLAPEMRGMGMGKRLMGIMEGFGRTVGVGKSMLTCFCENKAARGFYGRMGYELDCFSPEPRRLRNGTLKEPSYEILSKIL